MTQNGANSIIDSVRLALNEVKNAADVQTVIGDPITVGETTLIPVSKISIGVGLGGGTYGKDIPNNAGGGGTGLTVSPVAFIVIDKNGDTKLLNINSTESAPAGKISGTVNEIDKALDNVPGIITKVKGIFSKKKQNEDDVSTEASENVPENVNEEIDGNEE